MANTYKYVDDVHGNQEGDPDKAAGAIYKYVHEGRPHLRLPLGRTPLKVLRMKIESLEADFRANEELAVSTVYGD